MQVDSISQELVEAGFSYSGKDFLHSGITGVIKIAGHEKRPQGTAHFVL